MGRRVPDDGGGGAQAPTVPLRGPEEFPPIVVGLRLVRHPGTREGLSAIEEVPMVEFTTGPVP